MFKISQYFVIIQVNIYILIYLQVKRPSELRVERLRSHLMDVGVLMAHLQDEAFTMIVV